MLPSERVYRAVKARIEAGEWKSGERMPGNDALAEQYGVSRRTVNKAVGRLQADGLVVVIRAWGTFRA